MFLICPRNSSTKLVLPLSKRIQIYDWAMQDIRLTGWGRVWLRSKTTKRALNKCQNVVKKKLERNTLTSANSFRFSESSWHRREPRQIPYICLMGVSCFVYFCFILFFDFFRYVLLFIFARKRKREIRNNFVVLHDNCGCN